MNEPSRLGYRSSLDGLRGIAIVLVLIHHLQFYIYQGGPLLGLAYLPFGNLGVDIFFVLSGFLITTLLLEEHEKTGTIRLKHFYLRRAFRLLPALIVLLIAVNLFAQVALSGKEAIETARLSVYVIVYSSNWYFALGGLGSNLLGHLWSLAVEEQFYFLWPLVLSLLLRTGLSRRSLVLAVLITIVLVCAYRVMMISAGSTLVRVYTGSDTRADSILVGCAVAMFVTWRMAVIRPAVFKIAGVISIALIVAYIGNLFGLSNRAVYGVGLTIFALANGLLIVQIMMSPNQFVMLLLENRALVFIGKLSYSIYLWHFLTITISLLLPVFSEWRAVLAISLSFAFACLSYFLVETPFLKLKSRHFKASLWTARSIQSKGSKAGVLMDA